MANELFDLQCFVCHKTYGKGFSFHHVNYRPGRFRYSHFNNTINYHRYVLPEIRAEPHRFLLLCKAHHHLVEWGASIKDIELWRRFFLAVMITGSEIGGESKTSDPTLNSISLETKNGLRTYPLNNNSSLKRLLEGYTEINSMFGDMK